jgi:hypothetical protein
MINYSLFKKFKDDLPKKPYYSKNKDTGLKIAPKDIALKNPYIQFNSPFIKNCMVFDIDKEDSATYFIDLGLTPNFMITNKENGHSHYYYMLKQGVYFSKNSKKNIQVWFDNIYKSLCQKLNADISFNGLIAKNPFYDCDKWQTLNLTNHLYSLDELSKMCDFDYLEKTDPKKFVELGRNCGLFDCLRFFAYKEIRKVRFDYKAFWNSCEYFIKQANKNFSNPLSLNEISHILKSVCKWVYNHFSSNGFSNYQKQANRKSQKVRKEKASIKINECQSLFTSGLKAKEISNKLNYPLSSVYRFLAAANKPI